MPPASASIGNVRMPPGRLCVTGAKKSSNVRPKKKLKPSSRATLVGDGAVSMSRAKRRSRRKVAEERMIDLETIVACPAIANRGRARHAPWRQAVARTTGRARTNGRSSHAKPAQVFCRARLWHITRLWHIAGVAAAARRAKFPDAADHHDRAVSARRADRYVRPHHGRVHGRNAG